MVQLKILLKISVVVMRKQTRRIKGRLFDRNPNIGFPNQALMKLSRHINSIIIITIFIVFIISGTRTLQSAEARQQLINEIPPQRGSQAPNIPLPNFTGSISLTALFEVLKSKTNVSLADAMT